MIKKLFNSIECKDQPRFFFKRHFAFDISVIFSTLLITTIFTIIFYTYYQHSQSFLLEAKNAIVRTNENAISEVNGFLNTGKNTALFADLYDANDKESSLKLMRSILINYPHLKSIYVGDVHGNSILEIRIPQNKKDVLSNIPFFVDGASFVSESVINMGGYFITTWKYKDDNGKILKTITSKTNYFDARSRPWFKGAREKSNYWIGMYQFFGVSKNGITISYPINRGNQNIGVVGIDFNPNDISVFLSKFKKKNFENIFLIDHENMVIKSGDSKIPLDLLLKSNIKEDKKVFKLDGTSYIYNINEYLTDYGEKWKFVGVMKLNPLIYDLVKTNEFTLIFSFFMLFLTCCVSILCARRISKPISVITRETAKLQQLIFDNFELPSSNIIEINEMVGALSSTKAALSSFSKYLPFSLVEKLMEKGLSATLGGEKKVLTIMFSDITNFTQISEKLSVEELVSQLSEYLDTLTKVIHKQYGTVDKYLGDGIMAFWGAPILDNEHVKNGCLSALLCREQVRELNRKWEKNNKPLFHTRFGIHTGEVIIGNIGSSDRLNYTAIGDNVNIASRLQGINKQYSTEIIVSQDVVDQVSQAFLFRPLGKAQVKGKSQDIFVYELIGAMTSVPKQVLEENSLEINYDNYIKNLCIN